VPLTDTFGDMWEVLVWSLGVSDNLHQKSLSHQGHHRAIEAAIEPSRPPSSHRGRHRAIEPSRLDADGGWSHSFSPSRLAIEPSRLGIELRHRAIEAGALPTPRCTAYRGSAICRSGQIATNPLCRRFGRGRQAPNASPVHFEDGYREGTRSHRSTKTQRLFFCPSSEIPPGPCRVSSIRPPITERVWKK